MLNRFSQESSVLGSNSEKCEFQVMWDEDKIIGRDFKRGTD